MANRKINELSPRTPSLTDLIIVGDPSTGYSFKATISVLAAFAGSNIQFSSLQGISITNPTNGQALVYDGTNWTNQSISVPVTSVFGRTGVVVATEGDYSLDLLSDVTLTSPTTNQVLQYNGTAWVNATFVAGINSLNGLTATTQTFATGSSGTDFSISSTTSTHTFNLPTASAVNRGALSSADWSTFNAKQNAITLTTTGSSGSATLVGATLNIPTYTLAGLGGVSGSGTTNYLPKWTGSTALGNSLVFDNGTNVGIGTTSPTQFVEVKKDQNAATRLIVENATSGTAADATIHARISATNVVGLSKVSASYTTYKVINALDGVLYNGNQGHLVIFNDASNQQIRFATGASSTSQMTLFSNGNLGVGVGTTDAGYKLDVNGTARVQNNTFVQLRAQSTASSGGIEFIPSSGNAYELQATTSSTFILYDRTSAAQRLTVNSSGYLGIGINTPVAQLDVNGGIIAYGTVPATRASSLINDYFSGVARISAIGANGSTHGIITFNTAPSGTPTLTERMRIASTGNVLIGTTTDGAYKLLVNGTAQINGALTFASTATKIETQVSTSTYLLLTPSTGLKISNDSWVPSGTASGTTGYIYNTNTQKIFQNDPNTSSNSDAFLFSFRIAAGGSTAGLTHNGISLSRNINNSAAQTYNAIRVVQTDNSSSIANNVIGIYSDVSGGSNTSANRYSGIFMGGAIGIGTTSPNASALLDITSTTKGFLPPRMTNAQMVAIGTPASGLMVYDTTNNKLNVYDGTNWVAVH